MNIHVFSVFFLFLYVPLLGHSFTLVFSFGSLKLISLHVRRLESWNSHVNFTNLRFLYVHTKLQSINRNITKRKQQIYVPYLCNNICYQMGYMYAYWKAGLVCQFSCCIHGYNLHRHTHFYIPLNERERERDRNGTFPNRVNISNMQKM